MSELTLEQATEDALTALKEAGFGEKHGRPVKVASWREDWKVENRRYVRTDVTVSRNTDQDDAVRAVIVLHGVEVYSDRIARTATVWRRATEGGGDRE